MPESEVLVQQRKQNKMAQPDLGKDLLLMHARLFNHRAVLSGEIKQFVKEFETKRSNREYTRLEEIVSTADKIGHSLPECRDLAVARFDILQNKVNEATNKATEIFNRETNEEEMRKANTEIRDKEMSEFKEEMEKAQNDVERLHKERIQELKDKQHSSSD